MRTEEEINEAIEDWHNGNVLRGRENLELHEYLGWTFEEYASWVTTGNQPA